MTFNAISHDNDEKDEGEDDSHHMSFVLLNSIWSEEEEGINLLALLFERCLGTI